MVKKSISDVLVNFMGDHKDLDNAISGSISSLNKFGASAKSVVGSLVKIGAVGAVAVAGLTAVAWKVTSDYANLGAEIDKTMKITGLSAQTIAGLTYAAEQEHGSIVDLQTGWKHLAKDMVDAGNGLMASRRAFDELGISIYDTEGKLKGVDILTYEIADAFKGLDDDILKAALAQEYFGKSGLNILPFLEMGSKGITDLITEYESLGFVWTDELVGKAKAFTDKITLMEYGFKALKMQIGQELMPEFEKIVVWLNSNRDWIVTTFKEIFDIKVDDIGKNVTDSLDGIKNWVETNKDTLGNVFDGMKTAADMTVTSIKVLLASLVQLYATRNYVSAIGTPKEAAAREQFETISYETAGMYQDIGQKDWAAGIVAGLIPTSQPEAFDPKTGGYKPAIGNRLAGKVIESINITLDGEAVTKFLSGMMVTTTRTITQAGV